MTEALLQHIQQLLPNIDIPKEAMMAYFSNLSLPKETILLAEGECCNQIYFVNSGCLYLYYLHKGRKEVIHFATENWWITDYKTFADGKNAVYAIAAMENSEITCLSRANYEAMLFQFPFMALYFNKIHERAYGAALFKQKTFATVPKLDFYNQFRANYPSFLQRIPHNIFASYMGISSEELQSLIS